MMVQTEDVVDIIQDLFPVHDLELHYDQSSGLTKKPHYGLNADVMIKSFVGLRPAMRDTIIAPGCLDPCQHAGVLKVGQTQSMVFKDGNIGPWELTPSKRVAQKYDNANGAKKTKPKQKKDLLQERNLTKRRTKFKRGIAL